MQSWGRGPFHTDPASGRPQLITPAAPGTLLQMATPAWQGDSLSNAFKRVFGEVALTRSYFSLVKIYQRLKYNLTVVLHYQDQSKYKFC